MKGRENPHLQALAPVKISAGKAHGCLQWAFLKPEHSLKTREILPQELHPDLESLEKGVTDRTCPVSGEADGRICSLCKRCISAEGLWGFVVLIQANHQPGSVRSPVNGSETLQRWAGASDPQALPQFSEICPSSSCCH